MVRCRLAVAASVATLAATGAFHVQQPWGCGCRGPSSDGPAAQFPAARRRTRALAMEDREPRRQRPPTLPAGEFKPKQSLGQNYLSDQNYVAKIVNHFSDNSEGGCRVVELGPGAGALTQMLLERFPRMTAVDIDQRAVELLQESMPELTVVRSDVLQLDYTALARLRGGPLSVIGNLPYHITSQILFALLDHYSAVRSAIVTMQLEVAQRICARPNTKDYGTLSVAFQLYARPSILFKIPNTVFYPQPKVTSALLGLDFTGRGPNIDPRSLRLVLGTAFQQRRKMLRQSLRGVVPAGRELPAEFAARRPEQLTPDEFVELTARLFGRPGDSVTASAGAADGATLVAADAAALAVAAEPERAENGATAAAGLAAVLAGTGARVWRGGMSGPKT